MTETRTTSSSGGQKGVKPERHSLIPRDPMKWIARVFGFGAGKYADHNWRKGYEFSKSLDSLQRHVDEFTVGNDLDDESGLPHLAHAAFHILALLEWTQGPNKGCYAQFDDRYRQPEPEKDSDRVETWGTVGHVAADESFSISSRRVVGSGRPEPIKYFKPQFKLDELPKVDVGPYLKMMEEQAAKFEQLRQRLFVRPTPPTSFGVGDRVAFRVRWKDTGEVVGERVGYVRRFGGAWEFRGLEVAWTDEDITQLIAEGVSPKLPRHRFEVLSVERQRRPWRANTVDRWLDGDELTFIWGSAPYIRRDGQWFYGAVALSLDRISDDYMSDVVRDEIAAGRSFSAKMVGVSHSQETVRKLGG